MPRISFAHFAAYRSAVRMGAHAWPGGYPLIAIMSDGEVLCPACLKAERRAILESLANRNRSSGWHFEAIDTHMEGAPIVCAHCSKDIESAYGDPDQPDDAPAMVPQPAQQQQARARAPKPPHGERRYVTVRDTETGETHRVLTSVARVGFAVVIFTPSNRHREGALNGMLITHDDIRKAWVFNDQVEAHRALSRNGAPGERIIRAELIADPAPAA